MVRRIGEYTKLIFIVLIMITCTDPAPDEVEDLYPQEQILELQQKSGQNEKSCCIIL